MVNIERWVIIAVAFAITSLPASAVEGGIGRTLPGVWIQPQGAVVGPPGFSFTMLPIGYMGTIGGAREVPIAGSIYANVDANISTNYLVPQYVYKTETPKVSFSSSFMGVVNWVGSEGSLQLNTLSRRTSTSNAGVGDVVAVPLTVCQKGRISGFSILESISSRPVGSPAITFDCWIWLYTARRFQALEGA
jgi:hypothetical protein